MLLQRFLVAALLITFCAHVQAADPAMAVSPDGRVKIELSLRRSGDVDSAPHYRVLFEDTEIIGVSRLGALMNEGPPLGGASEILSVDTRSLHEQYTQVTGKQREIAADATEVVVRFQEVPEPRRIWEVVLRAYNDGAAFRYRFPKQAGWDHLDLKQERTQFQIPGDADVVALLLNSFTTPYEQRYLFKKAAALPEEGLIGLPLTFQTAKGISAAITEANVDEYAGLYVAPASDGLLGARLSPLPSADRFAVRAPLPHASPWRVILIGERPGQLVESNIVLNLSEPCAVSDTSWIKTGKTTFPWWNGFYEEHVDFKPGLNTATAKYYIDFCAEAGIPYHSLDGLDNIAWYGGTIVPYQGASITKGIDGLDLHEVLQYAKSKGVKIRAWMHWQAAEAHMEQAFPLYREWGIEGVMLDFLDRDDQEMYRFIRRAVKTAADNHLTITLHGCPKPTGLERTYPNLLTHEAVMNLEYDKWDPIGISAHHEVTVPFTRMLAGPLDFHQGSFRTVKPSEFKPRNAAPLVMGTPARTLASYVVYQNHLPMVADYPSAYRKHPGLPLLAAIPTTWDETRVLQGRIGQYIVIARRSGQAWYIGAMTDQSERSFEVKLNFLAAGRFAVQHAHDDDSNNINFAIEKRTVTASDTIPIRLSSGGGCLLQILPE